MNILDYDQKQVEAWAPKEIDIIAWNQSLLANYSLVATIAGKIVGFGDINDDGYLDRLYVHHLYLRQGIATRLCDELERHHEGRITVHASLTAINFFKKRGYSIITNQRVERRGCWLENFVMEKV
ncbi:MAG: GNAT family N-acetyltransferase [Erysipelotrichaceae bacterium]|nr:GNAT family N-acetyltransferase [Erysipelotrichaceae bacterium]